MIYLVERFLAVNSDPDAFVERSGTAADCVFDVVHALGGSGEAVAGGVALLRLFDNFAIHWDAFHGQKETLLQRLEKVRGLESFAKCLQLRNQRCPRALQCIAAQSAAQLDYRSWLQENMICWFVEMYQSSLLPDTSSCLSHCSHQDTVSRREAARCNSPSFVGGDRLDLGDDDSCGEGCSSDDGDDVAFCDFADYAQI